MKVKLDDIYAHVETSGEGDPLVLLHGSFCNTLLWQPQQELAERLQVIAVDLRGHGGTPCPVTSRSFNRPLDVMQIMDRLHLEKAFFCGLSMGGPIAIDLALDYPQRCLGLILLATGPGPADRPLKATQEMKDEAEREAQRLIELGPVQYFYTTQPVEAPGLKEFLEQPEQRAFFDRMLTHNNPEWLADVLRLRTVDVPPELEKLLSSRRTQRLQELDKPTLFMVGDLDQTFLPVADFFRDRVRHCELEIVPGATHLINIDSKSLVNARILDFVNRVTASQWFGSA
jgi:pimeloyl-ACP methyl ester carboxylesterase